MDSVYTRVTDSIAQAQEDYLMRQAAGLQPSLPFLSSQIILTGLSLSHSLITSCLIFACLSLLIFAEGNVLYFVITFILYVIMSRRQTGFSLKPVMAVYNIICVILAGIVVVGIARYKSKHLGNFCCNPVDTSEDGREVSWYLWLFLAQKFWEFFDTWFFILRKSFRQVTFLHLYHHSSISVVVGSIVLYEFNGNVYLPVFLNSFVHVLMYSHYFVTSLGMKTWWRHYLTSIQLFQFVLIFLQSAMGYYYGPKCGYDFAKVLLLFYMLTMLLLFGNFFVKQYLVKDERTAPAGSIKGDKKTE